MVSFRWDMVEQLLMLKITKFKRVFQKIVSQNLSVRETEALVKNHQEGLVTKPKTAKATSNTSEKTVELNAYFDTKVDVKIAANGKGKITIPFNSEADLNRIMQLLKK